ncbi:MAG: hypothetical protein R3F19_12170 [Verrucomicrobiales bacterium]
MPKGRRLLQRIPILPLTPDPLPVRRGASLVIPTNGRQAGSQRTVFDGAAELRRAAVARDPLPHAPAEAAKPSGDCGSERRSGAVGHGARPQG